MGAVLAAAGARATSGPALYLIELLGTGPPVAPTPDLHFALAVLGAVTLGWAVTLHAAIEAAVLLGDRARGVWRLMVAGLVTWFVTDSSVSVATGFSLNVVLNVALLIAFLVPIFAGGVLAKR